MNRRAVLVVHFLLLSSGLRSDRARAQDALAGTIRVEVAQETPLFEGRAGAWDSKIRERGWILRDGDSWRLWYTGYNPDQQPPMMKLGLATSADGLHWTRTSDHPLISDFWVEDMMVVRHDESYLMFAEGFQDQAQLLESTDGTQWHRIGTLDVRLTNGQPIPPGPFGTPTAFLSDGVWHLYYERRDAGIWLATSTDLKTWTNIQDEPVIVPGPGQYDSLMIAMNQVVRADDRYLAVLHGTGSPARPREWSTTLAESRDLIHWTKRPENPLRPPSENKSSGQLVHDGTGWRLYTMHDHVHVHRVQASPPVPD
jgi:beta-1,2-mannobiose phosphorylase / 1,2-beta-oligomannan phosphorylase